MIYGYARVSTEAQDLSNQVAQLKAAGCAIICREKISGATAERPQLKKLMARLSAGDVVVIPAVDRLSRDTTDLMVIARDIQRAGAGPSFAGTTRCRVIMRSPRSCAPTSMPPAAPRTAKVISSALRPGHNATLLLENPMAQADAWRMIRRRAVAAGIHAPIGNHSFRATGITAYLANGGALEHAQEMAAHESPRTTKLYDRTKERLTQQEVERIRL